MDGFLGEIKLFGGNYAPQGWKICNGDKLPIAGNEGLFSTIGITFGGDRTTFLLPKMESVRCAKGSAIYIINVSGTFARRA